MCSSRGKGLLAGQFGDESVRLLQRLEEMAVEQLPLLQHIMEKHLSLEARRVLERLAVATIPLGPLLSERAKVI